jgi:AcrR family transcriptional regulator
VSAPRRLRADAEANLERVIEAAEAMFDEHGPDVSIELVAQRASVGLGTIYRRFKNKEALVSELVRRLLAEAVDTAEAHLEDTDGRGLFRYLDEVGAVLARHPGSVARMWSDPSTKDLVRRSREAQAMLLKHAQQHGLVRPDLSAEDVAVALWSVHGVLDVTRGVRVDAWQRHLEIIIAGWTNSDATLKRRPLSPAQMTRVIKHSPSPAGQGKPRK